MEENTVPTSPAHANVHGATGFVPPDSNEVVDLSTHSEPRKKRARFKKTATDEAREAAQLHLANMWQVVQQNIQNSDVTPPFKLRRIKTVLKTENPNKGLKYVRIYACSVRQLPIPHMYMHMHLPIASAFTFTSSHAHARLLLTVCYVLLLFLAGQ